jgi:hypothetical protein
VSAREQRLVPLPFATLGELLAFGLEVHAYCVNCHTTRRVEVGVRRLRKPFAGTRFRCQCGGWGHPSIRPPDALIPVGDRIEFVDFYCGRCVPPWEIRYVRFDVPPWSACTLESGEGFACPCCREAIKMHARNRPGVPYTSRFRERD